MKPLNGIDFFKCSNFVSLESKVADKDCGEGTVRNKPHTSCEGTLAKSCLLKNISSFLLLKNHLKEQDQRLV